PRFPSPTLFRSRELLRGRARVAALPEGRTPKAERRPFVFLSVFDWSLHKGWDVLLEAFAREFAPTMDDRPPTADGGPTGNSELATRNSEPKAERRTPNAALLLKSWSSNGLSLDGIRAQANALLCER